MGNDNNRRSTRAMENARIEALMAENRVTIANATTSTSTRGSVPASALAPTSAPPSGGEPLGTLAPSSRNKPTTTTLAPYSSHGPKATVAPGTTKKSKIPTKPSTPKTLPKTSTKASTSKSCGKHSRVYNPDIDDETEEQIFVREPPTTRPSGPVVEDDNRAPASRKKKAPTISIRPPRKPTTAKKQALDDMARLALHEGPENAASAQLVAASSRSIMSPVQLPDGRQTHPAYPDLAPEVPRDGEGIRQSNPFVDFP